VNFAQISSAVPEIFEVQSKKQTNKKVADGTKNRTLFAFNNYYKLYYNKLKQLRLKTKLYRPLQSKTIEYH